MNKWNHNLSPLDGYISLPRSQKYKNINDYVYLSGSVYI